RTKLVSPPVAQSYRPFGQQTNTARFGPERQLPCASSASRSGRNASEAPILFKNARRENLASIMIMNCDGQDFTIHSREPQLRAVIAIPYPVSVTRRDLIK